MTSLPMTMYFSEFFSLELLGEKLENTLEISGITQGIMFLKIVATLNLLFSLYCHDKTSIS